MSPMVNKMWLPNQVLFIEFNFYFWQSLKLNQEKHLSMKLWRTDRANPSSHFVETTNLLCSIKLHWNLGLQSPLVLGQNFCNSYNNCCFQGSNPSNNPQIANFASKALDCCNESPIPNPPWSNGITIVNQETFPLAWLPSLLDHKI